jgi:hypothetical protein
MPVRHSLHWFALFVLQLLSKVQHAAAVMEAEACMCLCIRQVLTLVRKITVVLRTDIPWSLQSYIVVLRLSVLIVSLSGIIPHGMPNWILRPMCAVQSRHAGRVPGSFAQSTTACVCESLVVGCIVTQ